MPEVEPEEVAGEIVGYVSALGAAVTIILDDVSDADPERAARLAASLRQLTDDALPDDPPDVQRAKRRHNRVLQYFATHLVEGDS